MKIYIAIFLLLLIPFSLFSQKNSQILNNLIYYVDHQKDPGTAFILNFNLPAGGYFYMNHKYTFFHLLFDLGSTFFILKHEKYSLLIIQRFTFSAFAARESNKHNEQLKKRLNLDLYKQLK